MYSRGGFNKGGAMKGIDSEHVRDGAESMTVSELISILKGSPGDMAVVIGWEGTLNSIDEHSFSIRTLQSSDGAEVRVLEIDGENWI